MADFIDEAFLNAASTHQIRVKVMHGGYVVAYLSDFYTDDEGEECQRVEESLFTDIATMLDFVRKRIEYFEGPPTEEQLNEKEIKKAKRR